jgi:hypothetical protein
MNIPVNYVEHERQTDGRNIGVIITVMQPRSVMALDAWADVDAAIDAARQARKQRIERLTTLLRWSYSPCCMAHVADLQPH